ncbi:MAG: hypothetical protein CL694_08265 [Chloroflexi bacterium]|nr:hypothetical protein [Chloroflexota bacterium]MDP6419787.1 hypothetical protein [SAR202 cluster bacterium]HAL49734.1 hypothetical protein [Dehalococcoidia bacterium]MDP6662602.1 hypothetical protein [SAR202 cluster bacterium]MDP6798422.1 hypothetical protein [SAR202 cluster bacterium]|tara:strand:- start:182 stop:910 length:729 start_codon:yes stop_codon:yes gene_type:complete
MTQQPLSQMPKPRADSYGSARKLFLVPNYVFPPGVGDEAETMLQRYWSEVRDAVGNLERTLGQVNHVFHEMLFEEGDAAIPLIETMNPMGCGFIQALASSDANLVATEDGEMVNEHTDWQRILSMGPSSEKVMTMAMEGFQSTLQARYSKIAERIQETLGEGEVGVLFVREDHRVQFAADIQVFYVAPPALDALKRWIDNQVRAMQAAQMAADPDIPFSADDPADEAPDEESAAGDEQSEGG